MNDYQKLLALMDEYKNELKKRKEGVHNDEYDWKLREMKTKVIVPNNKARLNRLRIELSSLMLRIERQMTSTTGGSVGSEGWCK